jgi:hypothetical protein
VDHVPPRFQALAALLLNLRERAGGVPHIYFHLRGIAHSARAFIAPTMIYVGAILLVVVAGLIRGEPIGRPLGAKLIAAHEKREETPIPALRSSP